ncbi:hypothetical protein [Bifidobacterium sp. SO1]|uniref:hypothetical protein n=1 Tax=Bifidobacterium sp. SO1 TaxID=2809029 RepID=UPI001BDDB76E|nr:hypothetical protein [Bifidobacterium sp. SO1]MBT1162101.1 hypothetical protein [Bifidobacterium sp. SO1]
MIQPVSFQPTVKRQSTAETGRNTYGQAYMEYAYEGHEPWLYGILALLSAVFCPPVGLAVSVVCSIILLKRHENRSRSFQLTVGGITVSILIIAIVAVLFLLACGLVPALNTLAGYTNRLIAG